MIGVLGVWFQKQLHGLVVLQSTTDIRSPAVSKAGDDMLQILPSEGTQQHRTAARRENCAHNRVKQWQLYNQRRICDSRPELEFSQILMTCEWRESSVERKDMW